MGDQQLHTEHHVFTERKLQHATAINCSPRRDGARPPPPVHPYAAPEQPPLPHWSQENFESKKRVHATEIRYSPRRLRGDGAGGGGRRRSASSDGGGSGRGPHAHGCGEISRGVHRSQRGFAIEKLEHMTPVLPIRYEQPRSHSRDPQRFRHTSCDVLQKEKMGHRTPLYPEGPPSNARQGGSSVIDNYLNVKPHEEGFLHSSHQTFHREKMGHLTQINAQQQPASVQRAPSRQPSVSDGGSPLPHHSAEEFTRKKNRHATDIRASPRRRRSQSADPGAGGSRTPDHGPRSRSPPGCWHSRSGFQHAKRKHATPINPIGAGTPSPQRGAEPPDAGSAARRAGYTSFANLSVDKKRHVADVDAAARRGRDGATPQRGGRGGRGDASPAAPRSPGSCGGCGVEDVHQSHVGFTEEKMRHLTEVRQSPRRDRGGGGRHTPQPSPQRPANAQFSSLRALQRAKRGHTLTMGMGGGSRSTAARSPQRDGAAGGSDAGASPARHVSHRAFAEEKRGHTTGIASSPQPPRRGSQQRERGAPADGGAHGGDVHRSLKEFSAEKRQHATDIRQSPPRYQPRRGSADGSQRRGSGAAPEYVMTSHREFGHVKQRHAYEMDSPRRSQRRAAPAAVVSPSVPSSAAVSPARPYEGDRPAPQ